MTDPGPEPRQAGSEPVDDASLDRMKSDAGLRWVLRPSIQRSGGGGDGDTTCHTGWTFVCESHPPGTTCTSGFTFKCDTGTCSWGWTLLCDRRPI